MGDVETLRFFLERERQRPCEFELMAAVRLKESELGTGES